jgi:vacuolar-type H+-ATPase subunit E/Vma4
MTVDALIARLNADAQARIAAVRAGADAEISALAKASMKQSSRSVEQTLASRRTARQSAFAVERAATQRHAAASLLTAQHAFLDRVFARAESLAEAADTDSRHLDALPRQVAAVVVYLGDRPATLRCRVELEAHLRPLLGDAPQIELVADTGVPAGFIVSARDASCTIDCTLRARLAALRPKLEAGLLPRMPK